MLTYLDMIDLAAQTAMGRLHDALRRAKRARGSLRAFAEGEDPIHDTMVAILKEAHEAGLAEGVQQALSGAEQDIVQFRRENETLRSNCDHLSSENAGLSRQVDGMVTRIESLADELAKPEDARLREVLDALDGRFPVFDSAASRVSAALDETEEWIERAGEAERRLKKAEEVVAIARQLMAYDWGDRLQDCKVSDAAKLDSSKLSTALWLYDQEAKS